MTAATLIMKALVLTLCYWSVEHCCQPILWCCHVVFLWWVGILQYCHARLRTCVHWICISLMNLIGVFGCFDWTFLICGKIYYWHVIDLEILYRFLKLFIKFVYFCETTIKNLKLKKKKTIKINSTPFTFRNNCVEYKENRGTACFACAPIVDKF